MANINRVVLVGNLTRDPELRHTPSGTAVCSLRLAVNTRRKDGATGEWTDKPNYFDVTVWGNQGESCAQYLSKGRPVGIDGRLDWREWEAQDGTKRQAVEIIAESVQFLGGRDDNSGGGGGGGNQFVPAGAGASTSTDADFGGGADDDIPF
jgi:single-strand DNA-binding protein